MRNNEVKLILALIEGVDKKTDSIASDVEAIKQWKWQVIGAAIAVSAILSFVTTVGLAYASK